MLPPALRIILAIEAHQRTHHRGHGPTLKQLSRFLGGLNLRAALRVLRADGYIIRCATHHRIELTVRGRFVAHDLEDPPQVVCVSAEAPEGTKTCIDCGAEKPLGLFYLVHKDDPSGPRQSRCKQCDNDRRNRDVDHPMWRTA
jgi:hypothetical protein